MAIAAAINGASPVNRSCCRCCLDGNFQRLAVDMFVVVWGFTQLDAATRDAARAAASTDTQAAAITAANNSLAAHKTDGYWVTQPTLTCRSSNM